jgi:PTS system mannose-specific IIA component
MAFSALLPQCNISPKTPKGPLRSDFGWSTCGPFRAVQPAPAGSFDDRPRYRHPRAACRLVPRRSRTRGGAAVADRTITIGPDDDVEKRRYEIIEAVKRVDTGDGVVILTDMFGGTPSNLAISVMSRPKVEVLAGINLPMLVKLAKVRDDSPLPEAVAFAQEAGRKYITIASRVLAGK